MKILNELKRMKTKAFWERVGYWCAIKWTGKKNEAIAKEDWLPILTSVAIGILILIMFLLVSR